jgi:hypothetical protein
MNLKNQRARYLVAGPAVLLVGIVVFWLVQFPVQPIVTGDLAREEVQKIQAAVRHYRMQLFMKALRAKQWRALPGLLSVALGHPVGEVQVLYLNDKIKTTVLAKGKEGNGDPYFVVKSGTHWTVVEVPTPW